MCGNDTRSPVTSRESAAHGHTQREGKIHGARPPPPATPRAAPARPSARVPHSRTCATPHPTWRQTRRGPALQSTELVSQVSAGRIKPAARRRRLRADGRESGCNIHAEVGAGAGEGTRRGAALSAPGGRSAHPRAGPSRRASTGAHGLAAPIVPRTPLCRSERGGSMASPGARAPRGGRRGETRSGMVRAAAAARPTRAARRPRTPARRRDGAAGAAGRLCGARGGSVLTLGRAAAGDGSA